MSSADRGREAPSAPRLRVAYLVNQYPKISHTFIRREILALEEQGVEVTRIAVRGHETGSVDASDAEELAKTRYLLKANPIEMVAACLLAFLGAPAKFLKALVAALRLGARSDGGVSKHAAYFVEACILKKWLAAGGLRHVHAHFGTNAAAVVMFCRWLGGPGYSFTVHGPDEFDRPLRLALREKVQGAAFVCVISSFCRSQLYRWTMLADWLKIHVVRCALEPSYFEAPAGEITEKPKLLCVGRLSEEKGQFLAVRAARLLVDRGVPLELVLAGDGPLRGEIDAEVKRLADAMQVALTARPSQLAEMGQRGRKLTREMHNASLEAARLKELLAGALAGAETAPGRTASAEPARLGGI